MLPSDPPEKATEPRTLTQATPAPEPTLPFPIVGIGASAGGQEAVSKLLEHLPADPGIALVLVLHLDPRHESLLANILSRATKMPVCDAIDGMKVEINHLYVIQPNTSVVLTDGKLLVRPREIVRGQFLPIDQLFRSLAATQHSKAIGVVLSGGGSDGTLGLEEISAAEGITFAQDEHTARHDAMPRSAVASGCVDFVLPPEEIARELLRIARHPYAAQGEVTAEEQRILDPVFHTLRTTTGVDFAHYKRTTIGRRIRRRMALRGIDRLDAYIRVLHDEPAEAQALYQDLLIRVTTFFRDPAAFQALQESVFPRLLQERSPEGPIRVWVAGCSTGEEAYSVAIALLEFLGESASTTPIKILATDINEVALDKARAGIYLENIEMDVSPERLRRFFVRVNNHYQISKMIRDLCVFSRHNLLRDPPFSRLDLITCRNVLIYLDLALQKRVMPIFHYALKPGGFLMLGTSESIGTFGDIFEPVNERQRIYVRKPTGGLKFPFDFDLPGLLGESFRPEGAAGEKPLLSPATCSARPTGWCWRGTDRRVWSSMRA
jgi:two-component system CheB/CheR fusion protein